MNAAARRPKPLSFASLPAISREELLLTRRLRDAAATFVRVEAVADALGELAGEPVAISLRGACLLGGGPIPAHGVGILLAPAEGIGLASAALLDVEPALASGLVGRALRQRAPRVVDASRPVSPEIAGALAALVHAALRRVHAGAPLRVVAAGPAGTLGRDLAASHDRIVSASLTVVLGGDAFDVRVSAPSAALPPARDDRALSREALAAMGAAPIALPLVAMTCLVDREVLGALRAGDALVLPGFPLRAPLRGEHLVGPASLVAAASERGLAATLGEGGGLVLRSDALEEHPWDALASSSTCESMSQEPNLPLDAIEDAPVVVRVELGVLELKAREWAALAPGDVVTLGRKLGDPVVLRASGVELARGELVQVDGEYGVRILGRAGGR